MSRKLSGKIVISGKATAQAPLAVGGVGTGQGIDLEVAVNGYGQYYIPGTSLMGPIRHWMRSSIVQGDALTDALLGFQKGDNGHASFSFIEDAAIKLPKDLVAEVRTGIQIGRHDGTARETKFFTRQVLPRGSNFTFRMEVDLPEKDSGDLTFDGKDFKEAARLLTNHLNQNGLVFGSSKTRGLGRVSFEVETEVYDFSDTKHLFAWIADDESVKEPLNLEEAYSEKIVCRDDLKHISVTIDWRPVSAVMVKAGYDGIDVDMLPLVSGAEAEMVAPVIPGSSIKGVLRSHTAKIVRTMMAHNNQPVPRAEDTDVNPDQGLALVDELFGSAESMGRLGVQDVFYRKTARADSWFKEDNLDMLTDYHDHVAIDRFTGGASDGALYNVRTPKVETGWDPVSITVDLDRGHLSEEQRAALQAAVLLTLRDIEQGRVPLGFATNRGMGEIKVTGIVLAGEIDTHGESLAFPYGLDKGTLETLTTAWNNKYSDWFEADENDDSLEDRKRA